MLSPSVRLGGAAESLRRTGENISVASQWGAAAPRDKAVRDRGDFRPEMGILNSVLRLQSLSFGLGGDDAGAEPWLVRRVHADERNNDGDHQRARNLQASASAAQCIRLCG
jgi:hypothetical protein